MKRKIENLINIYTLKLNFVINDDKTKLTYNEYYNIVKIQAYTDIINELKKLYNEAE